jgi:RNA polymerase sigma factor (TIGR02999 family)
LEIQLADSLTDQVTVLLRAWTAGDKDAQDRLFELIDGELHRLARLYMSEERQDHILQPTALVNEAYIRLIDIREVRWEDRGHFFAVAARVMRRILVDSARARLYQKRGAGAEEIPFDETMFKAPQSDRDVVALDDALTALGKIDERKKKVVELKFFAGLDLKETAAALGVSPDTVTRDWKLAKVFLLREIKRARK